MPYDNVIGRDTVILRDETAAGIISAAVEQSNVLRLARRLRNMSAAQTRIPVLSALPVAYFVDGDTGLKQTTQVDWDSVYITAEELAVIVPIPDAVRDDAAFDVDSEIRPLVQQAIAAAIDAAILAGTNAPVSWPDDLLTGATAAGNTVAAGTGDDLYDDIMGVDGVLALVEEDGYMVDGHIADMTMAARLRGLRDAELRPLFVRTMQERPIFTLAGVPLLFDRMNSFSADDALMFSGDWNQLVYAFRQEITWTVTNTGVIQDGDGVIMYNLFQQDMTAIRAVVRMGWALPNPPRLLNDDENTRYPFSVLLPEAGGG